MPNSNSSGTLTDTILYLETIRKHRMLRLCWQLAVLHLGHLYPANKTKNEDAAPLPKTKSCQREMLQASACSRPMSLQWALEGQACSSGKLPVLRCHIPSIKKAELLEGVRCRPDLPRLFLRNDRLLFVLETPHGLAGRPQHWPCPI